MFSCPIKFMKFMKALKNKIKYYYTNDQYTTPADIFLAGQLSFSNGQ